MRFLLEQNGQLLPPTLRHDILRRFSPFLKEDGKLPICRVFFYTYDGRFDNTAVLGEINGYTFLLQPEGVLLTDGTDYVCVLEDYRRMDVYAHDKSSYTTVATLMMHAYQYIILMAGGLLLHGAGILYCGDGIAFCGVPGAGKSTQSRLWQRHLGAQALNNDQPGLVFSDNSLFLTGSPWSGKEPCYRNESAPLRALVFVEQAQENTAAPLSPAETYSRLYLNNYLFPVNPVCEAQYKQTVERIAQTVCAVLLRCTISEAAVQAAYSLLYPNRNYQEVRLMKYKASERFELKNVAGDWLLLPRGSFSIDYSAVIVFNDTGVFLWQQMQDWVTEQELVTALATKYSVETDIVAQDVAAFLAKMKADGIIEEG